MNDDLDYKHTHSNGGYLFTKLASSRETGNFGAGMFSASKGLLSGLIDYGYGAYNFSGNNKNITISVIALNSIAYMRNPLIGLSFYKLIKNFGEDSVSKDIQNLGHDYYKKHFK